MASATFCVCEIVHIHTFYTYIYIYINCKSLNFGQRKKKVVRSWTLQICILIPVLVGPGPRTESPEVGLGKLAQLGWLKLTLKHCEMILTLVICKLSPPLSKARHQFSVEDILWRNTVRLSALASHEPVLWNWNCSFDSFEQIAGVPNTRFP